MRPINGLCSRSRLLPDDFMPEFWMAFCAIVVEWPVEHFLTGSIADEWRSAELTPTGSSVAISGSLVVGIRFRRLGDVAGRPGSEMRALSNSLPRCHRLFCRDAMSFPTDPVYYAANDSHSPRSFQNEA
jgi:hypothetical protein